MPFCGIIPTGSENMYSLFIDTHDMDITIALYKDGKVIDTNIKKSERQHSDYTMPMIKEIIERNNLDVHDMGEILVVNGPGSFTGVRLGVTIAKTLAYTLNIPIKTISTMEMYAVSSPDADKLVILRDLKGVFCGLFKDHKLDGEMFYLANANFDEYVKNNHYEDIILENCEIDFNAVYDYLRNVKAGLAHNTNPIYIKEIEALKHA